ncbi:hypothetical protein [Bartonella sp. ML70XJBT.G]|uniref:hypothetical protein n=1 Tax=Bartonella sp. ML70XJBT.G TaxID=3019093 RepID=UPI002361D924|nr:hypothetical protein [Bartonella sp. ML70XJBT.G]
MELLSQQKASQKNKIPPAIIGLLPQIFSEHYTGKELDHLFFKLSAPNETEGDSKAFKTKKRLQAINMECDEPLKILGELLGDFMDNASHKSNEFSFDKKSEDQRHILETLKKDGLEYRRGGRIIKTGFLSTEALQKEVAKNGLSAIETEIKRALENIETDPMASALYAANLLEASCKAYLDHHSISYKETTLKLPDLWDKVVNKAKIHPKNMENENLNDLNTNDLKMITSGLYQIV